MTRTLHLVGTAALMVALAGCVPQEKYNALKLERDGLAEQLGKAQGDASAARAEAELAKQNLAAIMNGGNNTSALVTNLQQQNANLTSQLEELNRRYSDAMRMGGSGSALPAQLTSDLTNFANSNPDLVEFDAARGIVKFKSDVTFSTGDASLTPNAKEVITRFASILNSAAASGYELMVAGHTDNQPVTNPSTIQKGHKDNWYLSAHRAISVGEELTRQHVSPQRIGVLGYADQRPVSANNSEAGRKANRRVEILILPSTVHSNYVSAPAQNRTAPSARQSTPSKDGGSANAPTGSMFSK